MSKIPIQYWERLNHTKQDEIRHITDTLWLIYGDMATPMVKEVADTLKVVGRDKYDNEIIYQVSTL